MTVIENKRRISEIAEDIVLNCNIPKSAPYSEPYVRAMLELDSIDDMYYEDSAVDIVNRFLCNSQTWRGDKARTIKAELKSLLKTAK